MHDSIASDSAKRLTGRYPLAIDDTDGSQIRIDGEVGAVRDDDHHGAIIAKDRRHLAVEYAMGVSARLAFDLDALVVERDISLNAIDGILAYLKYQETSIDVSIFK